GSSAMQTGGTAMGSPGNLGSSATGFTTLSPTRGPNVFLDQMWISFDVEHKVFVTAGKQHVRWGTSRFWTPTDYLHPVKRNPLDVFDSRTGLTMLKLHVPWEAKAWNFYGFGIIEDPNAPTTTWHDVAGAGRAEIVQGPAELGLDFLVKNGQRPRFGADLSLGLGDFDFYGDAGLRFGEDFPIVHKTGAAQVPCPTSGAVDPPINQQFTIEPHASGFKPQIVGGVNWSTKYNDNDVFTIGAEYFYNSVGYSDTSLYPGLLFNVQQQPVVNFFYTGRHYAALFASLPAPYSWNYTTFTLSTIGNLSDLSFVSRLDYSVTLLTHLTFQAFAAVHYGTLGGELRLKLEDKQVVCNPMTGMPSNQPVDLFTPVP